MVADRFITVLGCLVCVVPHVGGQVEHNLLDANDRDVVIPFTQGQLTTPIGAMGINSGEGGGYAQRNVVSRCGWKNNVLRPLRGTHNSSSLSVPYVGLSHYGEILY